MVALAILVFLWHIPSALIPIITIPVAVIICFIPMKAVGLTADIMWLGGIAIAVGALVKLGTDRTFTFRPLSGRPFEEAYALLKDRLDQRLVAQLADAPGDVLWELPVKLLTRFGGSHGVLIATPDRLIFRTDRTGESRTWRFQDIDDISTSGPFQLTLTTFERARSHYGRRKGFNFQLKEPLSEARYNDLWRRLHPPSLPALAARASVDSP